MLLLSRVRLSPTRVNAENFLKHLRLSEKELPALSQVFPQHQPGNSKEILEFHTLLCEVMRDNGFEFIGIKVVPSSSESLVALKATNAVCTPLFSNAIQQSNSFSAKQRRVQFLEPFIFLKLGSSVPKTISQEACYGFGAAMGIGIELTGTRYPFYHPNITGFSCDLGGCIALNFGKENNFQGIPQDAISNHHFVLTRDKEPVQVGCGRLCMGNPMAAVALAAEYSHAIKSPLDKNHVVVFNGVSPRVPAVPGKICANFGVYGKSECTILP